MLSPSPGSPSLRALGTSQYLTLKCAYPHIERPGAPKPVTLPTLFCRISRAFYTLMPAGSPRAYRLQSKGDMPATRLNPNWECTCV